MPAHAARRSVQEQQEARGDVMQAVFRAVLAGSLLWSSPIFPAEAPGVPLPPLPAGPLHYDTAEGFPITVRVLARGLNHPWSIAFLPDGSALVTEKDAGVIRRIKDGVLQEQPVL